MSYKGSTKARPQGEESMGLFCVEPRNTGYEPTIMGTSSNWTGEKGLKDLVMPTCLAPSDVWPMINAHPRPFFLKGMGKSPWFLLANHRLNGMIEHDRTIGCWGTQGTKPSCETPRYLNGKPSDLLFYSRAAHWTLGSMFWNRQCLR